MSDVRMITRHAEALAVLSDPGYHVVAADTPGATSGVGWLRAAVCRFATGAAHARRRALVERRIATLDLTGLRRRARELSTMDADAGLVTVAVLAHALGIPVDAAPLVAGMSPAYFPGTQITRAADAAVDALVTVLGGRYDEQTAATIAILVQAHDATRGLVTRARCAGASLPVETLLVETLRWDPPVAWLWRVGADGERVGIDVRAANDDSDSYLTFGAGLRPCPGAAQALAIAAGILEGR